MSSKELKEGPRGASDEILGKLQLPIETPLTLEHRKLLGNGTLLRNIRVERFQLRDLVKMG